MELEEREIIDKISNLYSNYIQKKKNQQTWMIRVDWSAMCIDNVKFVSILNIKTISPEKYFFYLRLESPDFSFKKCNCKGNTYHRYLLGVKKIIVNGLTVDNIKDVFIEIRNYLDNIRFCKTKSQFVEKERYEMNVAEVSLFQKRMIEYKCPVCLEIGDHELMTNCNHYICFVCYAQLIHKNNKKCPICNKKGALTRFIKNCNSIQCSYSSLDDVSNDESDESVFIDEDEEVESEDDYDTDYEYNHPHPPETATLGYEYPNAEQIQEMSL